MTADERLHERREARIAAGRAAHERIRAGDHFCDWVSLADALVAVREQAMEEAHTNRPQGPPYRAAFKRLELREPWMQSYDSATRAHCYWLIEHLPAVTAWRDTLGTNQRDQWNHPSTVKRNYERTMVAKEPKVDGAQGSPVAGYKGAYR
jgi:hypothetical protein